MYLLYSLLGLLVIALLLWLLFLIKRGPKIVFFSALSGLMFLAVLKFLQAYHGFYVPINFITILFSTFLGVPGVIGILTIIFLFF